jgi:exoribonuclease R
VSALGNDFFQFDAARRTFSSRRLKKRFGLGDTLTVIVAKVNMMKRQIDFAPV